MRFFKEELRFFQRERGRWGVARWLAARSGFSIEPRNDGLMKMSDLRFFL
jgi:hypothetical protein